MKTYTCLHCGTQFVNLDGMLRCAHCGGRLVVMQDEELAPLGTGPETERKALESRYSCRPFQNRTGFQRTKPRSDIISSAFNLSLEEHKRDRSNESALEHHRRVAKARAHNRNLAEQRRKAGQDAVFVNTFNRSFNKAFNPRPRTTLGKFSLTLILLGLILLGSFTQFGEYSWDETPLCYVEIELRLGGQPLFNDREAPVQSYEISLHFANGTLAETLQTNSEGKVNSSTAYPMHTELYVTNWCEYNIGRFVVGPNNGEESCRVMLYLLD